MPRKKKAAPRTVRLSPQHTVQVALNTQRIDRMEPILDKIVERLDSIEEQLVRHRGFWGGVVMIGGAIATLLTTFKDDLMALFGRVAP